MKVFQSLVIGFVVAGIIFGAIDQSFQEFGYGICENYEVGSDANNICKKAVRDRGFPVVPFGIVMLVITGAAANWKTRD